MKIFKALVILAGLILVMPAVADDLNFTLRVKEQRPLKTPVDLERIAVADPEVADVLILRGSGKKAGSVLLVGEKAG
jgi:pilus assembly protein CpaC